MSYIFELYYRPPADQQKEAALTARVSALGGRLSYHEAPEAGTGGSICLTYEFGRRDQAEAAVQLLREQGEHVEGPVDYGGDLSS